MSADNPGNPAAETVVTGTKTEAEAKLELELKTERESHASTKEERKQREIRICELEDELRRLKNLPAAPVATPAKRSMMEKFLSGESED